MVVCSGDQLTRVEENSVLNQTFSCKSCKEYKGILEELIQELQSAKKIIQLLQEDINMSKDYSSSATSRLSCENNTSLVSNNESSWEKVLYKSSNRMTPHISPKTSGPYL
jgi:hypothetical protein